jgi:hypothetical protein
MGKKNNSNIVGEPIETYVGDQIKIRQKIYGSGTPDNPRLPEHISYLNSRTSWIKLASGTSMDALRIAMLKKDNDLVSGEEGSSLAQNNVLFGGLSRKQGDKLIGRSGITGVNKAYGVGGTEFGFSPMPGILNADIKSLNRGSIKKATINIKAHNKNQFDVIDALYMRLGYTVLLEWGNEKYFDNKGELISMGPTLIEKSFFNSENDSTDYSKWLPLIEEEREKKAGNYEAMFGVISNFSWTFESDGSYSIKVDIISMGDVIESLKANVPVASRITVQEFTTSQQGSEISNSVEVTGGLTSQQFIRDFVIDNNTGEVDKDKAKAAGYYAIDANDFSLYMTKWDIKEEVRNRRFGKNKARPFTLEQQKRLDNIKIYYDFVSKTPGAKVRGITGTGVIYRRKKGQLNLDHWYYILDNVVLYEIAKEINNEGYNTPDTEYSKALDKHTIEREKQLEEKEELIETQVLKLRDSKIHYLFFKIREVAMVFQKTASQKGSKRHRYTKKEKISIHPSKQIKKTIGNILNFNSRTQNEIIQLGLPESNTADIISTEIISNKNKNYYIRLGTLLDYIRNHVITKISPNMDPYLEVDTDIERNIMYHIPNQLSTDPRICLIKNENFNKGDIVQSYFDTLESFVGNVDDIKYGKIMNIYMNFDYIEQLLESSDKIIPVSMFTFLSRICDGINLSLGGVNNLEPIIDEKRNTIVLLEQTHIPGREKLLQALDITPPETPTPPVIEIFGYNPKNNTSNFVRDVGLTTSVTKEYATMITVGATAGGYVPGVEATAFSRWNAGIKDRFKNSLIDGDSRSEDPLLDFEKENKGVKSKYKEYLIQPIEEIIGINYKSENNSTSYPINIDKINFNSSTVENFNKYIQASASISSYSKNTDPNSITNVDSSVGFLPFNLSLTMDGIGGFKLYQKLEVNTSFLPSNYPKSLEFIISGVDHKLNNNLWETTLNSIGIPKGNEKGSTVQIGNILSSLSGIETPGARYSSEVPINVPGAYEVWNGSPTRGGYGRRYKFEDLGTHWPGSTGYTKYIRDEFMRTGEISVLESNENTVVYDLVMYAEENGIKTNRCNLPSPIGGEVISAGAGGNSTTTIMGRGGETVKMLHMSEVYVKKGQIISKGDIIGRQGDVMTSSKVSRNVHLHIQCSRKVLTDYIYMLVKGAESETKIVASSEARRVYRNIPR